MTDVDLTGQLQIYFAEGGSERQITLEPQEVVFDNEAVDMSSNSRDFSYDHALDMSSKVAFDKEAVNMSSSLSECFADEAVDMLSSLSEQTKFKIEEIGNEASQRQPEFMQVEEMPQQGISTLKPQRVVFDVEALKMPKSSGQIEFQIEDNDMEPEADRPEEAQLFLMQGGLSRRRMRTGRMPKRFT